MFVLAGTNVANWVNDYTTVNRAILHIAPAAAAFGALLLWHWAQARGRRTRPRPRRPKLPPSLQRRPLSRSRRSK